MAKPGDQVRFLNSVGGGRITRIVDKLAYVEDVDGFETPVLLRECVVVGADPVVSKAVTPPPAVVVPSVPPRHVVAEPEEDELDIEETETGDTMNLQIAYEPHDLKSISSTAFDTYLINDSNYYIYFTYLSRERSSKEWRTRYSGLVEPNIQVFIEELTREDLPCIDYVAVGVLPFKKGKDFTAPAPVMAERRLDTTKFAKLHCFQPSLYFESPVLSVPLIIDGEVVSAAPAIKDSEAKELEKQLKSKVRADKRKTRPTLKQSVAKRNGDVIVVDLHIDELLDTTRGLGPAEILNYQVDTFRRVMDENAKAKGQKIVFIHGKGEGVLRNALLKELTHRYKGNDVQDASFAEYGYGATQVTIL